MNYGFFALTKDGVRSHSSPGFHWAQAQLTKFVQQFWLCCYPYTQSICSASISKIETSDFDDAV